MATDTESGIGDAAGVAPSPETGLPQLDVTTFANQIFWLVVALVVIYFILSKIALPRIESVLAERQGKITNDLAAAEELKAKAAADEEEYQQALADARAQAQETAAKAKAEMQTKIDAAMAKADARIAAEAAESEERIAAIHAGAADAIKQVANDTAKEVVASLGMDIDAKAVESAVAARLKG